MRKHFCIFLVIFSFFLSPVHSGFSQGTMKPIPETKKTNTPENPSSIVFNEMEYDYGEVEEGVEVTHIFKFKNNGISKLKIEDVKTSCGCTAAL
ncbi:DUF1573 domain-containing protein, partial [bacterium]|nr:DUF1573 domain-containing protein [bacterium]